MGEFLNVSLLSGEAIPSYLRTEYLLHGALFKPEVRAKKSPTQPSLAHQACIDRESSRLKDKTVLARLRPALTTIREEIGAGDRRSP
jgi:hypothetical protein